MNVKVKPGKGNGWIAVDEVTGRIAAWDTTVGLLRIRLRDLGWTEVVSPNVTAEIARRSAAIQAQKAAAVTR